jgi:hypothetical protein
MRMLHVVICGISGSTTFFAKQATCSASQNTPWWITDLLLVKSYPINTVLLTSVLGLGFNTAETNFDHAECELARTLWALRAFVFVDNWVAKFEDYVWLFSISPFCQFVSTYVWLLLNQIIWAGYTTGSERGPYGPSGGHAWFLRGHKRMKGGGATMTTELATKPLLPEHSVSNLKLNQNFPYRLHTPQHRILILKPCLALKRGGGLFKGKQGLRMRQMLLYSDTHNVGAYLCRCVTVRLVEIIRVYMLRV